MSRSSLELSQESMRGIDYGRELTKDINEVYQTGYYLYWIVNFIGEPVEYYIEEGKYAEWDSAKTSIVHLVENGQKIPLCLSRSLFKVFFFKKKTIPFHYFIYIEKRFLSIRMEHSYFITSCGFCQIHLWNCSKQNWRNIP